MFGQSEFWRRLVLGAIVALISSLYSVGPADAAERAPSRPSGVRVSHAAATALTYTWRESRGATEYRLRYGLHSDGSDAKSVTIGDSATASINDLTPNTIYYADVTAVNAAGVASAATRRVKGVTKLATPTGLEVAASTATSLTVSWSKSQDATSYRVRYGLKSDGSGARTRSVRDVDSVVLSRLKTGVTYYISVTARYRSNSSEPTALIEGVPELSPTPTPRPPGHWEAPRLIDSPTQPRIVDCLTATHCVALDGGGNFSKYDGSTWSDPYVIDPDAIDYRWGYRGFVLLDCPSSSFCLAIDATSRAWEYDGSDWTAGPRAFADFSTRGPSLLSCGSPTHCVMVGTDEKAYVYDGTGWSAGSAVPGNTGTVRSMVGIDCVDTTCMVVTHDRTMRADQLAGANMWGEPSTVYAAPAAFGEISCSSMNFCMIGVNGLTPKVWNGSAWSDTPPISNAPGHGKVDSGLECVASGYCMWALDGAFYLYSSGEWTILANIDHAFHLACDPSRVNCIVPRTGQPDSWIKAGNPPTSGQAAEYRERHVLRLVDCPTASYCHAATREEVSFEYESGAWSGPRAFDDSAVFRFPYLSTSYTRTPSVRGFDCSGPTYCVGVGQFDYPNNPVNAWRRFDGTNWSRNFEIGTSGGAVEDVSCWATGKCIAVDDEGGARTLNQETWTDAQSIAPATFDHPGLLSISCPSALFCATVGGVGEAVIKDGDWGDRVYLPTKTLNDVSCTPSKFCVAVGDDRSGTSTKPAGAAVTYRPNDGWSEPTVLDTTLSLFGVSCADENLCVAITDSSIAYVLENGQWSGPQDVAPGRVLTVVSCVPNGECSVIDTAGRQFRWTADEG